MSSNLQERLQSSLIDLASLINSANSSNINTENILFSIDSLNKKHSNTLIQIADHLKRSKGPANNSSTPSQEKAEKMSHLKHCTKAIKKLRNSNLKITEEIQKFKDFPYSIKALFEETKKHLNKLEQKFLDLGSSGKYHSESTPSNNLKNLEFQTACLNTSIPNFLETSPAISSGFSYQGLSDSFENLQKNFEIFSMKLSTLNTKISSLKTSEFLSTWKKFKNFSSNFEIASDSPDKPLILILNEILNLSKKETVSPCVEILISDSASEQKIKEDYEGFLISNLELKSLLIKAEGDLSQTRKLENQISDLKSKTELLEKVNKELTSQKNDSDDSLDLDSDNIKNAIEIQELKAALRSLSERYEQEKENLLKDITESQQDMETQIFRLQNEKNYSEVKLKDSEKLVTDLIREKERLESVISTLKKENERLKDSKTLDAKTPASRRGSSELQHSLEFDLTESIEKFAANSSDLYEVLQEELNEIVFDLQENGILLDEGSTVQILRKSSKLLVLIKSLIEEESTEHVIQKDLVTELKDFIHKTKSKITQLEQDTNSKILEKEKKIQELLKNENFEIRTEPSPRSSDFRVSEKEKSKLHRKKIKISLHKEQIALLKQNIRDLQTELEGSRKTNLFILKEIWLQIFKEIPILGKSTEDLLEVFMRKLTFTKQDFLSLTAERKSKNGRKKLSLF